MSLWKYNCYHGNIIVTMTLLGHWQNDCHYNDNIVTVALRFLCRSEWLREKIGKNIYLRRQIRIKAHFKTTIKTFSAGGYWSFSAYTCWKWVYMNFSDIFYYGWCQCKKYVTKITKNGTFLVRQISKITLIIFSPSSGNKTSSFFSTDIRKLG